MKRYCFIAALFYCCMAVLSGCGVRKKTADRELEQQRYREQVAHRQQVAELETMYYGDVLQGSLLVDSLQADSSVFESRGLRLVFKPVQTSGGRVVLGFSAAAKEVARSSLRYSQQDSTSTKQTAAVRQKEQTTLQTRPGVWPFYLLILAGAALTLLAIKTIKK